MEPGLQGRKLLSLYDDALLAVLAFLEPRDLFRCRVVCRRLRDLCLHPQLWRDVKLDHPDEGLLRAVLSLAPCIGEIDWVYHRVGLLEETNTRCVVAGLELTFEEVDDVDRGIAVMSKLAALGGLKRLCINMSLLRKDKVAPVLKTVYSIQGIQRLEIMNDSSWAVPAVRLDSVGRPSLTELFYHSPNADSFLELLLRTHAASLQYVCTTLLKDVPVTLLAKIPKLHCLRCYPSEDLPLLLALPNLHEIDLYETFSRVKCFPPGALNFLSRAAYLRTVQLSLPQKNLTAPVLALSKSPSAPNLEILRLWGVNRTSASDLVSLVFSAPSKFPCLKLLEMDCAFPHDLLPAVNSSSAPCLTALHVQPPADTCFHAWVHEPAIQDVLVRNPRLHLCVWHRVVLKDCPRCPCPWCRRGCHRLEVHPSSEWISFSSHSRKADCPFDCYQVTVPM